MRFNPNKEIPMCKQVKNCVHDRKNGKAAVEAYLAGKYRGNLCTSRMRYLEEMTLEFEADCEDKGDDYLSILVEIRQSLEELWHPEQYPVYQKARKSNHYGQLDMIIPGDRDIQVDISTGGYLLVERLNTPDVLEGVCHQIAWRAIRKEHIMSRIRWFQTAKELEDKARAFLWPFHEKKMAGTLTSRDRILLGKAKKRLNKLRYDFGSLYWREDKKPHKSGCITHTQWAMLVNNINCLLNIDKYYSFNEKEDINALIEQEIDKLYHLDSSTSIVEKEDREQDTQLRRLEKLCTEKRAVELAREVEMWHRSNTVAGYRVR